eukprot:ctg_29.g16
MGPHAGWPETAPRRRAPFRRLRKQPVAVKWDGQHFFGGPNRPDERTAEPGCPARATRPGASTDSRRRVAWARLHRVLGGSGEGSGEVQRRAEEMEAGELVNERVGEAESGWSDEPTRTVGSPDAMDCTAASPPVWGAAYRFVATAYLLVSFVYMRFWLERLPMITFTSQNFLLLTAAFTTLSVGTVATCAVASTASPPSSPTRCRRRMCSTSRRLSDVLLFVRSDLLSHARRVDLLLPGHSQATGLPAAADHPVVVRCMSSVGARTATLAQPLLRRCPAAAAIVRAERVYHRERVGQQVGPGAVRVAGAYRQFLHVIQHGVEAVKALARRDRLRTTRLRTLRAGVLLQALLALIRHQRRGASRFAGRPRLRLVRRRIQHHTGQKRVRLLDGVVPQLGAAGRAQHQILSSGLVGVVRRRRTGHLHAVQGVEGGRALRLELQHIVAVGVLQHQRSAVADGEQIRQAVEIVVDQVQLRGGIEAHRILAAAVGDRGGDGISQRGRAAETAPIAIPAGAVRVGHVMQVAVAADRQHAHGALRHKIAKNQLSQGGRGAERSPRRRGRGRR